MSHPAIAFYEWVEGPGGKAAPLRFTSADDGWLMLAGIWEDGEGGPCFSMLTTEPSDFVRKVHDRMPAVLADDQIGPYLDGELHEFGPSSVPLQHAAAANFLKTHEPPPPPAEGGQGYLFERGRANTFFDWRQPPAGCIPAVVPRPLTALFVDCDSFFASVEQQLDPALRGLPIGVAPVLAETSCCIAASYEAKRFGVKTGTGIREARILCPGIRIVQAKPSEYVKVHHRVIEAVEDCIHVEAVMSIDEMWAWLPLNWRDPDFVRDLGMKIKASVASHVGESVKVSVGVAPNRYLAKLASKMRKPDGLFVIEECDLPGVLHELELRDLTGVAKSMESRLHAVGIHTMKTLCAAPMHLLRAAWGGVLGDRMWHHLLGDIVPDLVTSRKSIGHSHALPPDERVPAKAWPVACKLLHKAYERLRSHEMLAGALTLHLAFLRDVTWTPEIRFPETDSTVLLMRRLERLWRDRPDPRASLIQVGVTLTRLFDRKNHTPDLFAGMVSEEMAADDPKQQRLDAEIDRLRARYGRSVVYFGSVQDHREAAPMRISFTHIPNLGLEED